MEIKGSEDNKISIGRVLDAHFNAENFSLSKESQNTFKLISKNSISNPNKTESKFTSTVMSEQTAKYILLSYRPSKNSIDIYPTEEWNSFKKEPNYKIKDIEEVEEIMKNQGKPNDLKSRKGKGKKGDKLMLDLDQEDGGKDDDNDEDRKLFEAEKPEPMFPLKKKKKKGMGDDDDELELSDMDEDDFYDKFKYIEKKEEKPEIDPNKEIETPSVENSIDDSLLGEDEGIESLADEGMSEELDDDENSDGKNNDITGNKRKREAEYENNREKKLKTDKIIEDAFVGILTRKRKLKKDEFIKELKMLNYDDSEIQLKIQTLLNKFCSRFDERNETFYVAKNK